MSSTKKPECAGDLMLREKLYREKESLHRAACHGEADQEIEGKFYCLMHAPTKDKYLDHVLRDKIEAKDYNFRGVWFSQPFSFQDYEFESDVDFSFAEFNDFIDLKKAIFSGNVNFKGVKFRGFINYLNDAIFNGIVDFSEAQFDEQTFVYFTKSRFNNGVKFCEAQFNGRTQFDETQFGGKDSDFSKVKFNNGVNFRKAQFSCDNANFKDAQFADWNEFDEVQFSGKADFGSVEFSQGASFSKTLFKGEASFQNVQFNCGAYFNKAQFQADADFNSARFKHARFNKTQFSGDAFFYAAQFDGNDTYFNSACFAGAITDFSNARFLQTVHFEETVFSQALGFIDTLFEKPAFFDNAVFKPETIAVFILARFIDFVRFMECRIEDGAELYFGEVIFEKPERVHFHSLKLQPYWFINVDTREFNFENVSFPLLKKRKAVMLETAKAQKLFARFEELKNDLAPGTKLKDIALPYRLLITTYRRLALNSEENNRYEEAMGFRYLAMDTHRQSDWWRRFFPITLHWWYWASSGYGERVFRASVMLFLVWFLPFLFYASPLSTFHRSVTDNDIVLNYITSDASGKLPDMADLPALSAIRENNLRDAAFYSLNVMAFQKPEPKPANDSWLTRLIVILQTLLGPVQATLLLLAIRRKFMR